MGTAASTFKLLNMILKVCHCTYHTQGRYNSDGSGEWNILEASNVLIHVAYLLNIVIIECVDFQIDFNIILLEWELLDVLACIK